jgi:hypothetical protein
MSPDQSRTWRKARADVLGWHFALFQGPDLAVAFKDAKSALVYMAEHADTLSDDFALMVFDTEGHCQIALVDARVAYELEREKARETTTGVRSVRECDSPSANPGGPFGV